MKRSGGYSIPSRSSEEKQKNPEKSKFSKLNPRGNKGDDEPTEDVNKNMLFESVVNPDVDSMQEGKFENEFGEFGHVIPGAENLKSNNFIFATRAENHQINNGLQVAEDSNNPIEHQLTKGKPISGSHTSQKPDIESSNSLL